MPSIQMVNEKTDRFYNMHIMQDMLGDWNLIRYYGGLHNRRSHDMRTIHSNKEQAQLCLQQVVKVRVGRGYVLYNNKN